MLRLRAGRLSVTGGSTVLGGNTGGPGSLVLFDCSLLEKPIPSHGQDPAAADPTTGSDKILAAAFSPSGEYFALTDDRKRVVLFQTEPAWDRLSVRFVSRRCMALTFSACGTSILVADKSGDIFSFSVIRPLEEGRLELGHLSMLLDVAVSPDGRHVITCDRDEKIRVSLWDSPHVISAFCLGHREFVSRLLVLPGAEKLLVSGSGDGTLRLWEYETGAEIHSWDLTRCMGSQAAGQFAVSRITCCPHGKHVAVLCDSVSGINMFSVTSGPRLMHTKYLALSCAPLDLDFEDSTCLWVLSGDPTRPLMLYRWTDEEWQVSSEDGALKRHMEEIHKHWENLKGSVERENNFRGLYKSVCDNMAAYLRKKESRLELEKRKTAPSRAESPSKMQKTEL
ncbi:tRNA (guanine-N(7)-)-methyltransferase non-catalytic subunit WDR4 [Pelodytes ibericus]